MNGYLIVLIIITIVAICGLIYIYSSNKINKYNSKLISAEKKIKTNIDKKHKLIIKIAKTVKKVTKKDYMKDSIELDKELSNIDKDNKLSDSEKLFNNLYKDYVSLRKNKEIKKDIEELREINEILIAAKRMYNDNAKALNDVISKIPHNIISKFLNINIVNYYINIKTDDMEIDS